MNQWQHECLQVYLRPGELHLARRPAILRTILGSCVGVTFWSARLGVGALCHAMLPRCPQTSSVGLGFAESRRYVDFCIRYLAQKFDALGAARLELEVKVFGGADVLPVSAKASPQTTIGAQNRKVAMELLQAEGFVIAATDLGGTFGRSILFHTGTGEVMLRRLPTLGEAHLSERQRRTARMKPEYELS